MPKKRLLRAGFSVCLLFVCLFLSFIPRAEAAERILLFRSDIEVNPDGTMTVSETITVNAQGINIKRGIYRDFPTRYKDRFGNAYVVDFDVLLIERDGVEEPWHSEKRVNGLRIYIGRKDYFLPSGVYTYTITYRTGRQLGFFDEYDELYWNVTSNEWAFPIDRAEAHIKLPDDAARHIVSHDAYTGPSGAAGKDFTYAVDYRDTVIFTASRPLMEREGLTIAVAWPKGYVEEPDTMARIGYVMRDNRSLWVIILAVFAVLGYYLVTWHHFGRDPAKGTVIPLYNPPKGFAAHQMRFIMRMGFDHKVLTSCILSMAVKGYLTVIEDNGAYTLIKKGEHEDELSFDEKKTARALFGGSDVLILKNHNHKRINDAIAELRDALEKNFQKLYFQTNRRYRVIGMVLSGLMALPSIISLPAERTVMAVFLTVWLSIWSVGVIALFTQVSSLWKGLLLSRVGLRVAGAVAMTLFALPFFIGELVGLGIFTYLATPAVGFGMLILVVINLVFSRLLKAPTISGRMVMDKFEGFKMYLGTAEKDRLNVLNPPEKTPELFERYLPYAFALDVEQAWSDKFSGVLEKAAQKEEPYRPGWYQGRSWDRLGASGFASGFSTSFAGAISASSHAPGSSSGGFGGGSSGGGGGGGGGGGW